MATLTEFRDTLLKYPDRFHMSETEVQQEVELVRYFSEFVDPEEDIAAVEADPDDDKFLEAAVAGSVDYLVSTGICSISNRSAGSTSSSREPSTSDSMSGRSTAMPSPVGIDR